MLSTTTLRLRKKKEVLEAQMRKSAKRDLRRAQEHNRTRAHKLGDAWMEQASKDARYRDLLKITVEKLKGERGGKIFEGWAIPGVRDADDAASHVNDFIATTEAEVASDGSETSAEGEAETVGADVGNAPIVVKWEARFPKSPASAVRLQLKKFGRFDDVAQVWSCQSDPRMVEEIRSAVEQAGGTLKVLPPATAA